VASAAAVQRLSTMAAAPLLGFFVAFCGRVAGRAPDRFERATWIFAGTAFAAVAAGLFFDPDQPSEAWIGSEFAPGPPAAKLLWPGRIAMAGTSLLALTAVARLGLAARRERALRATFFAAAIPAATATWDFGVRLSGLDLPMVTSAAGVLTVGAVSYALVARFARIDAELAVRRVELARSHDSLRRAQEELVRKEQLAAVGELSAVIAHEVQAPLAAIRHAVLGLGPDRGPGTDALLVTVDEEIHRLNRLVGNLLAYARPTTPQPEPIDLGALLPRAVELAREARPARAPIAFEVDVDPATAGFEGDPALLRHAIVSILDNAIEAMPEGGTIRVRCRPAALENGRPGISIELSDEGEGMDTLVRTRAREPFFGARPTGAGLGLAIVDRIARIHGGRVDIHGAPGSGTTVTVYLPRARVSLPSPASFD